MPNSDGTEDDFEVLKVELSARSIAVSLSGSESDTETSEVFASKATMIFNHMDQYTEPIYNALFPHRYS